MKRRFVLAGITAACMVFGPVFDNRAAAASAEEINAAADAALARLQQSEPVTAEMLGNAKINLLVTAFYIWPAYRNFSALDVAGGSRASQGISLGDLAGMKAQIKCWSEGECLADQIS